jgi:glucosamine--fructose-6-phosphate aminotransferase (isomerizing)
VRRCLRGRRIQVDEGNAKLGGLNMSPRDLAAIDGRHRWAAARATTRAWPPRWRIEALARVPARAEIASEFRYRHPIIPREALYFAVSQSGETADTLGAVQEVQLKGGEVMGVVNVVGSTIARDLRPRACTCTPAPRSRGQHQGLHLARSRR